MHETYQATWDKQDDTKTCWIDLPPSEKLPQLRYSETDTDGWEDFDVPVLYFYGGFMPYVSRYVVLFPPESVSCSLSSHSNRDLLQWPLARPSDGLIDVAIQETASLPSLISQMGAASQGGQYWSNTVSEETFLSTDPDPSLFVPLFPPNLFLKNLTLIATLL